MKMYTNNDNSSNLRVKYTGDKLFHFSLRWAHKTFLVSYNQDVQKHKLVLLCGQSHILWKSINSSQVTVCQLVDKYIQTHW